MEELKVSEQTSKFIRAIKALNDGYNLANEAIENFCVPELSTEIINEIEPHFQSIVKAIQEVLLDSITDRIDNKGNEI